MPFPNPYSSLISTAKLFRLDRRRKAERPHNLLSWGESLYVRAFGTWKSMAKPFPEGANLISQTLKQVHKRKDPRELRKRIKKKKELVKVSLRKRHGLFHFSKLKKSVMFLIPSLYAAQGAWILVTTPETGPCSYFLFHRIFFFCGCTEAPFKEQEVLRTL